LPTVVVVEPGDVILAEVVAELYLDEHQVRRAGVLDPVGGPPGDVDGLTSGDRQLGTVQGDDAVARHHEPMFGSPLMALVAEALARRHCDPLDLVVGGVVEDRVAPPRALICFPGWHDHIMHA